MYVIVVRRMLLYPHQSDDAYADLNTLGEAINRVKRPLGTRRAPGQHCQHIKLKNPDFKNGTSYMHK